MCSVQPPPTLIVFMWPWQAPNDWMFIGLLALGSAVAAGATFFTQLRLLEEHDIVGKLRLRRVTVALTFFAVFIVLVAAQQLLWMLPAHRRLSSWYLDQFGHLIALHCDATPLTVTYRQLDEVLQRWTLITIGALSVGLLLVFVAGYAIRRVASRTRQRW